VESLFLSMQTNNQTESFHSDFESKLKKIIKTFEQDKTLFFTVSYLILTGIGMVFSIVYFRYFGINILEYSQISDFILIAFKDPFYVFFFILTVVIAYLLYFWDKWIFKKFPKFWNFSHKFSPINPSANTYLFTYGLLILVYTSQAAMFYGKYNAKQIKSGSGTPVKVYLTTGSEPVATDSLPLLIGTTSSVIFLYHPKTKSTEIVPFNSIRKIVIQDKDEKMPALKQALLQLANPERAIIATRFFKTGKGQYGEGDIFIGLSNPQVQSLVKEYWKSMNLSDIQELTNDPIHELRFAGLLVLVAKFPKSSHFQQQEIVNFYVSNVRQINNWDLVDCSAYKILGKFLLKKDRQILYNLADSGHLWSERIAVVSTLEFIRNGQFSDIFKLSEKFLVHKHDLMHKACGWMLREVGKRDELALEEFLDEHLQKMPRTMLRYAIERMEEGKRLRYLKG
jgi:3-methyladenine DNA glycosylase AlkD